MRSIIKKIDFKYGLVLVGVLSLGFVLQQDDIRRFLLKHLKVILTAKKVSEGFLISVAIVSLIHHFKFNNYKNFKEASFEEFKRIFSEIIDLVVTPVTLVGSTAILKGLAMNYLYDVKYFLNFSSGELFFIFLISFYFFIKSAIQFISNTKEIWTNTKQVK